MSTNRVPLPSVANPRPTNHFLSAILAVLTTTAAACVPGGDSDDLTDSPETSTTEGGAETSTSGLGCAGFEDPIGMNGACSDLPLPFYCGDGEVQVGEECDDGNDEDWDGCSTLCLQNRCIIDGLLEIGREQCDPQLSPTGVCDPETCTKEGFLVFASSEPFEMEYQGYKGRKAADMLCNDLGAGLQGLSHDAEGNPWRFKAWLGDGNEGPLDTFPSLYDPTYKDLRYVLVMGILVANDAGDLLDGMTSASIKIDEMAGAVPDGTLVWTHVQPDGNTQFGIPCAESGQAWSAPSQRSFAAVGDPSKKTPEWTDYGISACSLPHHVYCVEQPSQ